MVYKDNVAYHGKVTVLTQHFSLIQHLPAEEFEIQPPPKKIVPFSGMITEARNQLPIDYTEPVEEIRRKIILTVWMTSIHFETAQQSPSVNHNGYQSTLNSMLKRVLPQKLKE